MDSITKYIANSNNILVYHVTGSHTYGTAIASSDEDKRGVFIANFRDYLSYRSKIETHITKENGDDVSWFEFSKFFNLLINMNPNIIETLWVEDRFVLQTSKAYEYLKSRRKELLSKQLIAAYGGYAYSQIKRLKGHNKWINNAKPINPPEQKEFFSLVYNLTTEKIFKFDEQKFQDGYVLKHFGSNVYGIFEHKGGKCFDKKGSIIEVSEELNEQIQKHRQVPVHVVKYNESQYRQELLDHSNYWKWVKERNPERSELEHQHGYDTKHAMHAVRLIDTALDALESHELVVFRKDANKLLAIRNGEFTYEQILNEIEEKNEKLKTYSEQSTLRERVTADTCEEIYFAILELMWNLKF